MAGETFLPYRQNVKSTRNVFVGGNNFFAGTTHLAGSWPPVVAWAGTAWAKIIPSRPLRRPEQGCQSLSGPVEEGGPTVSTFVVAV